MTSRERVLSAFAHAQADTVPIDFGGHRSSGIAAIAYAKLRDAPGVAEKPIRVYDPIQQLAVIDDDVLERFGVDTTELGRGFAQEEKWWQDWTLPDGTPCQHAGVAAAGEVPRANGSFSRRAAERWDGCPTGRCTSSRQTSPSRSVMTFPPSRRRWTRRCGPPWRLPRGPICGRPGGPEKLRPGARRLRASSSRAIIGLFGGNLLEAGQFLYRNDNFFMLLAGEPRRAEAFLDKLVEIHLERPGEVPGARRDRSSTSSCSAMTWACSPDRRSHPTCTAASSSRDTSGCGGGPRSLRPSR